MLRNFLYRFVLTLVQTIQCTLFWKVFNCLKFKPAKEVLPIFNKSLTKLDALLNFTLLICQVWVSNSQLLTENCWSRWKISLCGWLNEFIKAVSMHFWCDENQIATCVLKWRRIHFCQLCYSFKEQNEKRSYFIRCWLSCLRSEIK